MKYGLLLLLFVSRLALAADLVSLNLHGVTVPDLARAVFDDYLGNSLVMDSEVLKDREMFSVSLKASSRETVEREVKTLIESRGFRVEMKAGLVRIKKGTPEEDDLIVYAPRFRSVSYLQDLVGGLLPHGASLAQREIGQMVQPGVGGQSGGAPGVGVPAGQNQQQGAGRFSVSSVNSMIDRPDKDLLVLKVPAALSRQVRQLLVDIDKPAGELLVKAVVLEVQSSKTEASAVSLIASLLTKGAGVSINVGGAVDKGNMISLKVGGFEALWSAVSSDSRFKVVSAPQMRIRSGASGRFVVGSETPVLGAVQYQQNGQAVQSVDYKPAGVILDLKPEIRGQVADLRIFQQLSNFVQTQNGVNNSPTLFKRELNTSVVVQKSDVVLLGGLNEDKTSTDDAGLFFLPHWMRSRGSDSSGTEIVLMLYVEEVKASGEAI